MKITVSNLNLRRKLNVNFIKKITRMVLRNIKRSRSRIDLDLVFLDDRAIRVFNKAYKGKDRPTDVLSFNINAEELKTGRTFGEVLISSDTAFRNSKAFKTNFEEEIALYVIHGILHLFGYEDETAGDRGKMFRLQERVLRALCGKEDLSKVLMPR